MLKGFCNVIIGSGSEVWSNGDIGEIVILQEIETGTWGLGKDFMIIKWIPVSIIIYISLDKYVTMVHSVEKIRRA